jgi:hypothetical protein
LHFLLYTDEDVCRINFRGAEKQVNTTVLVHKGKGITTVETVKIRRVLITEER